MYIIKGMIKLILGIIVASIALLILVPSDNSSEWSQDSLGGKTKAEAYYNGKRYQEEKKKEEAVEELKEVIDSIANK